jgi:hypothetical protein
LLAACPGYVHQPGRKGGHPGHSLENVRAVPTTAFDVFAGWPTLDAWIANTDRHDNNWSVLRTRQTRGPVPLRLLTGRGFPQVRGPPVNGSNG